MEFISAARYQLERFGNLDRGDDADDRHDYTGCVAGRSTRSGWRLLKNATQAGCLMRPNRHRYAVRANRRAVDPIRVVLHARVVDEIARGEVVGAVENDVAIADELFDVGVIDVRDVWFDLDL